MSKDKKSVWIKIYIIILFFFGVGIWFSLHPTQKQKISMDIILDKKIIDILVSNGIIQNDILSQYIMERSTSTSQWNEFYKTVKLKSDKTVQFIETRFRSLARSMKIGLNKVNNPDGSVTYKFYLPSKNYYNITFVCSKKS